jgi:flavin-dependent dehydrogenase
LPAVASSPIIFEGTMKLLEEIGIAEDNYALPGSRAEHFVLNFVGHFDVIIPVSERLNLQRSYIRGLDRAHFDYTLWKKMETLAPYITLRQGFGMTDLLRDTEGKICGIVGKESKSGEETFTADLVVGADGRFSLTASKIGAKVVEERNSFVTGGYEAQWEGVLPYKPGLPTEVSFYNTARGYSTLFMPISEGRYYAGAYMRAQDAQRGSQTPQEFYIDCLKRIPEAWQRLAGATQVSDLEGIRPIENGYREAFGPGWALVGDAFHYKDPLDGQGIYDALTETKLLAQAIHRWKSGEIPWEQAGVAYRQKAWAFSYPMFQMTTARIQREMHTFPPNVVINTLIRWQLTDPQYQTDFLRALARIGEPLDVTSLPSAGTMLRGLLRSFYSNGNESAA